jgi:hypothetical protein
LKVKNYIYIPERQDFLDAGIALSKARYFSVPENKKQACSTLALQLPAYIYPKSKFKVSQMNTKPHLSFEKWGLGVRGSVLF